eukprot:jgi/Mesvir1/15441/Mv06624-RA.1
MYRDIGKTNPGGAALLDPSPEHPSEYTYGQLSNSISDFALGLRSLAGVQRGDCASIFAENSPRWLITDQGIMAAGGVDAVRGAKAPIEELVYIVEHSDSVVLVVENMDLLQRLAPALDEAGVAGPLRLAVLLWGEVTGPVKGLPSTCQVASFNDVIKAGASSRSAGASVHDLPRVNGDSLATIVYTSGTTGHPKGVMLTQANLMHQVANFLYVIQPRPDAHSRALCLLPSWHMYERSVEYFFCSRGVQMVYTTVPRFKEDVAKFAPDYLVGVPIIFETLYKTVLKKMEEASAVRQKIAAFFLKTSAAYIAACALVAGQSLGAAKPGGAPTVFDFWKAVAMTILLAPLHALAMKLVYAKIKAVINIKGLAVSGGGSLPSHVEEFFTIIGIPLLNGYGLTECSPVLSCRTPQNNPLGTVGAPVPGTEFRVVDIETHEVLPHGSQGLIHARGPQIMRGYYKNEAASRAAVDEDGWFDTGDLGWIVPANVPAAALRCAGMIVHAGRVKDLVVLASGENVEPLPLEEAMLRSPMIRQVMVVGQDKRRIGALVVPSDTLMEQKAAGSISGKDLEKMLQKEVSAQLNNLKGLRPQEHITHVHVVEEPFTVDNGLLTPTLKMRRIVIEQKFRKQIDVMLH